MLHKYAFTTQYFMSAQYKELKLLKHQLTVLMT